MFPRILLGAAAMFGLSLAPAARAAECPRDTIALYTLYPVEYVAAAAESIIATRSARYDLRAGTMQIDHQGSLGWMFLSSSDRYRVVGLPDGTPVQIEALFDLDGFVKTDGCGGSGCYGEFGGSFTDGTTALSRSVEATFYPGRFPLVETLSIPIQVLAGQEFELRMRLWFNRAPGASHSGGGSGRVRFGSIPQGAAVHSCQGYDSVVPVRSTSWGRMKSIYR